MKKRFFAIFMVVAMAVSMLPGTTFSVFAEDAKHPCYDEDCTVCTVADMINNLPAADDITIENAAAVLAQIHAIDRIKFELDTDYYDENDMCEYDYLLTLVDTEPPESGFGMPVPKRYTEALEAVQKLNVGGSLVVLKKYSVGNAKLDWEQADATFSIECVDAGNAFEPLTITLADLYGSDLEGRFYSANEDGWTNTYKLPAGTYKITETDYTAVTEDGKELTTTPTYSVAGVETPESAIVVVEEGQVSQLEITNTYNPTVRIIAVDADNNDTPLTGAHIQVINSENEIVEEWVSDVTEHNVTGLTLGKYTIRVNVPPDGYHCGTGTDEYEEFPFEISNGSISSDFPGVKETNLLQIPVHKTKVPFSIVQILHDEGTAPLENVSIEIFDGDQKITEWTSDTTSHTLEGLKINTIYTIKATPPDDTYYFADDFTKFTIDNTGNIFAIKDSGDEEYNVTQLQISFGTFNYYYIPLIGKTLTYGQPFGGNIIDLSNVTYNGELCEPQSISQIGQAFYIECKNTVDNKTYDTKNGALIPVGTYKVTGKEYALPEGEIATTRYTFNSPVDVIVNPKELTADDFIVTAAEKEYDGNTDVTLSVNIRKVSRPNKAAGLEIKGFNDQSPVYDEVTAVIEGSFDNAEPGTNKTVNYKITALTGTDAANYKLPDGGITGEIKGTITHTHSFTLKQVIPTALKSEATCTDAAVYYMSCACGAISDTETFISGDPKGHTPAKEATCTEKALCASCDEYYGNALDHDWDAWNKLDGSKHIRICKRDSSHAEMMPHDPDLVCGQNPETCKDCNASAADDHTYSQEWHASSTTHWKECIECGAKEGEAAHKYNANVDSKVPQTCPICEYGGHITRVTPGDFNDSDIPSTLKPVYGTVAEIQDAMKAELENANANTDGFELYDAILEYSLDGGVNWYKASESFFPDDGYLAVKMEVPQETNLDAHNYTVLHMFSSDAFGKKAGDIEFPDVLEVKDDDGKQYISFYVTGLSPIMIAWEKAPTPAPTSDSGTGVGTANGDKPVGVAEGGANANAAGSGANTGDDSNILAWAILAVTSALTGAVTLIRRRKKA